MFKIYIKDFNNSNGVLVTEETLVQQIPAKNQYDLKLLDPKVKNEMGSSETLSFSIEPGTKFYDAFLQMKTYMRITYEDDTIFYGRVLTISNNTFRGTRQIRMEGPLAFLTDSPVEGVEESKRAKITTLAYMQKLISGHNKYCASEPNKKFMLGNVPGNYSSVTEAQKIKNDTQAFGSDSWTDTKAALEDLRSHYGGYFRTRAAGKIGKGVYLDWMNHYFNSKKISQKIEVGKNVLDISNVTEINNIFTAIIPIGRHSVVSSSNTATSSNTGSTRMENLYLDDRVVYVPDIINQYSVGELNSGYHKYEDYRDAIKNYGIIIKPVTFQEADTKEKLRKAAFEWIKNNYQGGVTKFTIKAIDMHQIGDTKVSKIMIGDQVEIRYPVGNEKGTFTTKKITLTCLSIDFDLYHPENNSYTFGIPANMLTKTYGVKKAGSVNSGITDPPKATPTIAPDRERPWIRVVGSWLMNHKLHYNGPMPFVEDDEHRSHMYAINDEDNQIYWPTQDKLYNAYIKNTSGEYAAGSYKNFKSENPPRVFDEDTIDAYHVCEFVKYMYGIDLRTDLEVKAPDITVNQSGWITLWQTVQNGADEGISKVKSMFIKLGELLSTHKLDVLGPDGQQIYSYIAEDGNWHYYYLDPKTGEKVDTNIRDLDISAVDSEKKVGWIVTEKPNGKYGINEENLGPDTFPGQMTVAIENFADGELVVARLSGELMYLGNKSTQFAKISGDNILFKVNPQDEDSDTVSFAMFRNGVQTSVTKHETVIKNLLGIEGEISIAEGSTTMNNANSIQQVVGQFMTVDDGHGNKILKIISGGGVEIERDGARFGLWDKGNLTGGVMIDRINNDSSSNNKKISGTRISLKASQVIVDNSETHNVLEWMTGLGGDVDTYIGLITPALTTLQATVKDLKTDKLEAADLTADLINSKFGSSATFKAGAIETGSLMYKYGTPSGTDSFSFGNLIKNLKIVQNGNSYTLKYLKVSAPDDDSNYITVGSFSRAVTSWNKGWSNGVLTITPIPQATPSFKVGIGKKWNTDNVDLEVISNGAAKRHKDSSNNYVAGQIECPVVLNELTGSQPNSVYEKDVTFSVSSILETITNATIGASAKTFTPSKEYIGIGSIKVTPTHSAPSGTAIGAHDIKATGISITADGKSATAALAKETFKPTGSTSNVRGVTLTLGSTVIGRIDTNSYYTEGYAAGQASASSPSIDIPNNGFDIQGWEPTGTKLNLLKSAIMNAINYKMWLYFKVTAGNTSKQYYMDFT